jgi:hypothetical protein
MGSRGLRSGDNLGTPKPETAANPRGSAAPAGEQTVAPGHLHRRFRPHGLAVPPRRTPSEAPDDSGTTPPRWGIRGETSCRIRKAPAHSHPGRLPQKAHSLRRPPQKFLAGRREEALGREGSLSDLEMKWRNSGRPCRFRCRPMGETGAASMKAASREDPPGRRLVREPSRPPERRSERVLEEPSIASNPLLARSRRARWNDRPKGPGALRNRRLAPGHTERHARGASASDPRLVRGSIRASPQRQEQGDFPCHSVRPPQSDRPRPTHLEAIAPGRHLATGTGMARPNSGAAPSGRPSGSPERNHRSFVIDRLLEGTVSPRTDRPSSEDPPALRSAATEPTRSSSPSRAPGRIGSRVDQEPGLSSWVTPPERVICVHRRNINKKPRGAPANRDSRGIDKQTLTT